MDQEIIDVSFSDFLRFHKQGKNFQNRLFITEMRGDSPKKPEIEEGKSVRLEAFSVILVRKGQMDITIDNFTYHLSDNLSRAIIMSFHVIKNVRISHDFVGCSLVVERKLLAEIMQDNRMPAVYGATWRNCPVRDLREEDAELLESYIRRIEWNIDRNEHIWQRDMIMNELRGFMLEMNNFIYQSLRKGILVNPPGRDKLLFMFFQLLQKHCKEQHAVSFYSGELSITTEYLSRILKEFSGKTANKWIAESLMFEAEICLRNPNLTIQQIADYLNFSDQSAFGKFFKKNKGLSPLAYRSDIDQ